jgi:hypothetical protein
MAFIISFNSLLYYNTGVSVYYLIYKNSKRELENDKILNEEYMAFVHVLMAVIVIININEDWSIPYHSSRIPHLFLL